MDFSVDTQDRRTARRALNQADGLLGDLEELQLRGHTEVPSWCRDSASALRWASIEAGVRDPCLESESGVIKLMDDVYTLEDRLMRRLRVRTVRAVSRRSLDSEAATGPQRVVASVSA